MHFAKLIAAICLASAPAWAGVTVTHSDPERFTDASDRGSDPGRVMGELKQHLELLGERFARGKNIAIQVLDVDRAGRAHMGPNDMRVMTGRSDFPCVELSAGLEGAAATKERVCDMDYLRRLPPPYNADEPLTFEKRMLEEWFKQRFGR